MDHPHPARVRALIIAGSAGIWSCAPVAEPWHTNLQYLSAHHVEKFAITNPAHAEAPVFVGNKYKDYWDNAYRFTRVQADALCITTEQFRTPPATWDATRFGLAAVSDLREPREITALHKPTSSTVLGAIDSIDGKGTQAELCFAGSELFRKDSRYLYLVGGEGRNHEIVGIVWMLEDPKAPPPPLKPGEVRRTRRF